MFLINQEKQKLFFFDVLSVIYYSPLSYRPLLERWFVWVAVFWKRGGFFDHDSCKSYILVSGNIGKNFIFVP